MQLHFLTMPMILIFSKIQKLSLLVLKKKIKVLPWDKWIANTSDVIWWKKTGFTSKMWYCPQNIGTLAQWYIFICVIVMNVKICVICNFNALRKGYKDYTQLWREEINSNWRISDKIIIIIITKLRQYFAKLKSYTTVELIPLHWQTGLFYLYQYMVCGL